MFLGKLHNQIPSRFGFSSIITGLKKNNKNQEKITSFWIAEVRSFHYRSQAGDYPVIAVVETNKWRRGIVLIPDFEERNNLSPIDIGLENDHVIKQLRKINLFPLVPFGIELGGTERKYGIKYGTPFNSGYIDVTTTVDKTKELRDLHDAIIDTAILMTNLYEDKLLSEYISKFFEPHGTPD